MNTACVERGRILLLVAAFSGGASAADVVGRLSGDFATNGVGAATYTIPLNVAAGMNGLKPAIALAYNSAGGDGLAGVGWSLAGFSEIARCGLTPAVDGRVQGVRYAREDRFCLDGQPLVLVRGAYGGDGAEYRTEAHNYQKIISYGTQGSGPQYFEVLHPNGLTYRYGNDADSRIAVAGGSAEVRVWAVNEIEDLYFQRIVFNYSQDALNGEYVPAEIRWTYSYDEAPTATRYRLRFGFDTRPPEDVHSGYVWGTPWRMSKRLTTIDYEHDPGGGYVRVHRYTLGYRVPAAGGSQRSQLASIQQCGPVDCLAPTTVLWQDGTAGFSAEKAAPAADYANAAFGDFDGDGDTDLFVPAAGYWTLALASNGTLGVAGNTGQRFYGAGIPLDFNGDGRIDLLTRGAGPNWVVLQSTGVFGTSAFTVVDTGIAAATMPFPTAIDLDGDGRHDLVYVVPVSGVWIVRNTGGVFAAPRLSSIRASSGWVLSAVDGLLKVGDFDGDGREDILVASGPPGQWGWAPFLSTGTDFDPSPLRVGFSVATSSPDDMIVADVNGDGLSDLLSYAKGQWLVQLSHGVNPRVTSLPVLSAIVAPYCAEYITAASSAKTIALDLNGDGRADLLRANGSLWRVHLSDGQCYSNSQRVLDIAGIASANNGKVATADFDGDGYVDLLFTQPTNSATIRTHSGGKTDLVAQFTDGLGNSTQVSYRALSGWNGYTATAAAVAPSERLLRGGALYVMSQFTATTGLVAPGPLTYTTTFSYTDARLDTRGRGFLGFARVRATDSRDGLVTETAYLQSFPYTGRIDLQTVWNGTHRVSVLDPTWAVHTEAAAPGDAAGDYHFVYASREIREDYETDGDGLYNFGLVRRTTRAFNQWDFNHGVAASEQTTVESPQAADGTYTTTRAVTLNDTLRTARWCLGQPDRINLTRTAGGVSVTRSVEYGYMVGTCRMTKQVEGPAARPAEQLVTSQSYDLYGRLLAIARAPADASLPARRTSYVYDGEGYRSASESQSIDGESPHVTLHGWDNALGLETSRTDVQGRVTRWAYDNFGRSTAESRSTGSSTTSYASCGCFPAAAKYRIRTADTNGHWAETYHDAMGRVVGRAFVLINGAESRQITDYDAFGRLARESVPFIAGGAVYWATQAYDLVGRLKLENRPVSTATPSGATTSYVYSGLRTDVRDAEQRTTSYSYDVEDRLQAVNAPLQGGASYRYTPFGELAAIYDAALNVTTMSYDERGLRIAIRGADSGQRQLRYNAFGELVSQSDAKSPANTATYLYDQLGRLRQRTEPEGIQTWSYVSAAGPGKGLLQRVTGPTGFSAAGFEEIYSYDSLGRAKTVTTVIDGTSYITDYAYNVFGQLATMTYPPTVGGARPTFAYTYANGYLDTVSQQIAGWGSAQVYQIVAQDALARETHVAFGGGALGAVALYDPANTRLLALRSGAGVRATVQNYAYQWDKVGNLLSRQDANGNVTETFSYDSLDRLSGAHRNGQPSLAVNYFPDGNIQSRSDVGTFKYSPGTAPPHAVTGISGGPRAAQTFTYDANGNMTSRAGAAISWTSYNLPKQVNATSTNCSADCAIFAYGPSRQRVKQVRRTGNAVTVISYISPFFEVESSGGKVTYRSHVFANGEIVYTQTESTDWSLAGYYVLRDHQHSVDRLVRAAGADADRFAMSFDAWGKRRNADWTADPTDLRFTDRIWSTRGYTGQEHLDGEKLIHMNGRIEDPISGRMLSPDPVPGSLAYPQTLNPYSYAGNNPTSFIDPSGFFLGRIGSFLHRLANHSVGFSFGHRIMRKYGREIVAIVAAYYTAGAASAWIGAADASAAAAAGAVTAEGAAAATLSAEATVLGWAAGGAVAGAISTGTLKGALLGGVTGAAFGGVDVAFGSQYSFGRVLTDAGVGGLSSSLMGGSFGDGFKLAGSLSALTYAATSMRTAMVEQSRIDPRNASGLSAGFRGDAFKLGGCRTPCVSSLLGGVQGGPGSFFGRAYAPGSFLDHLIETYAGPHDFLNAPAFYNSVGNNVVRTGLLASIMEPISFANVAVATPFAIASVVPPYAYPNHD